MTTGRAAIHEPTRRQWPIGSARHEEGDCTNPETSRTRISDSLHMSDPGRAATPYGSDRPRAISTTPTGPAPAPTNPGVREPGTPHEETRQRH